MVVWLCVCVREREKEKSEERRVRRDVHVTYHVTTGGSSMFEGLVERMNKELQYNVPCNTTVNVVAPSWRKYAVWLGGSVVTSLSSFKSMWITKKEFEECGPSIVHYKAY